ncbi:MAG: flagellar export chaperone FliS [Alphaproteobacteria bacterium]|nr:flagellar export chaperone FliS [Alphaproteobacteria bacterium]
MYNTSKNMHQYKAYATANMTVGKTRQVVMLYDGALRFIQQSIEAITREDYETRYNLLAKTSEIISGLQNSLDFENGGDISKLLYDYYASLDARLFTVHRSNDVAMLEAVSKEIRMMRNVWHEIDQEQSGAAKTSAEADSSAPVMPTTEAYSGVGVSA